MKRQLPERFCIEFDSESGDSERFGHNPSDSKNSAKFRKPIRRNAERGSLRGAVGDSVTNFTEHGDSAHIGEERKDLQR